MLALVVAGPAASFGASAASEPLITDVEDAILAARLSLMTSGALLPEEIIGLKAVAARKDSDGRSYWVVEFSGRGGKPAGRVVISAEDGFESTDKTVLKRFAAWDSYLERNAFVGNWYWAVAGIVAGLAAAVGAYFWSRKPRMGWGASAISSMLSAVVVLFAFGLFVSSDLMDGRGVVASGIPLVALVGARIYAGIERNRRYRLEVVPISQTQEPTAAPAAGSAGIPVAVSKSGRPAGAGGAADAVDLHVTPAEQLPSFADVGGMETVKAQLRETVGTIISHGDLVRRYGIDWNGVLLYGPPGVGKTFMAKATAGEYGLNFIDVRVSDMISRFAGESTKMVAEVFRQAGAHRPCVLFFDEFDSVAQRREDAAWDTESTRVVNQLLRELEGAREVPDLVVMAATNHKDTLDEAVIRPGRFDRHIAIDLPDAEARATIFAARLKDKPVVENLDLTEIVALTDGMSAADISTIVNGAALEALRQFVRSGAEQGEPQSPITNDLLLASLRELRAKVRPTVAVTSWDELVLDPETKTKLMEFQEQIERADELVLRGIEPPRGLLLYGPPGTGKTTIAKVLATQTEASFFAADASELVSMWLGESQKHVARLFDAARRSRPAIVFIDEIDSLVPRRGGGDGGSWMDDVTSQFLREIDGIQSAAGVFVVGATNEPDALDPALLRGGRLSRQIRIPLPAEQERAQLFRVHSSRMRLEPDIDFGELARKTSGLSGADIEEICDAAALRAMRREAQLVSAEDFETARAAYSADRRKPASRWAAGSDDTTNGSFGFSAPARRGDSAGSAKPEDPEGGRG